MKERISLWQLFIILNIFLVGSAVVVGAGEEAKQDYWLAELIALSLGVIIVIGYFILLSRIPGKNIFELIEAGFGKVVGKAIIFFYIIYFLYIAARVLRDFGELILTTILPLTPVEVVPLVMCLLLAYALYLGIEVFARMTEVIGPFIVLSLLLVGVFLFIGGDLEFNRLLPVLEDGLGPVLDAVFPTMVTFPYGELIVCTILMTQTNHFHYVRKVGVIAVILSGLLIAYSNVIQITTLGVDIKVRSSFPLLVAAREIEVFDFFERVDILIVFTLMFGIMIKAGIFLYGGLKGLEHLFKIPYRAFLFPTSMLLAFFSVIIAENIVEHYEEGLALVPYFLHLPFQFGIPILLGLILLIKQRKSQSSTGGLDV
ncbi:GerAB/ArcD/ProY family transporter [Alkalihalobacterium elongatum]|uniref:GerAB/ArcD/ProY family transporter n=1 Tax=Alkalihalobacterium elongatum TaxID=2675466 RepID=UPI001C1FCDCD|nr:endospore germination permease [Alkalihalobacterium elongatum]